jgi:hypothetical protein
MILAVRGRRRAQRTRRAVAPRALTRLTWNSDSKAAGAMRVRGLLHYALERPDQAADRFYRTFGLRDLG